MPNVALAENGYSNLFEICPVLPVFLTSLNGDDALGALSRKRLNALTCETLYCAAPIRRLPVLTRAAMECAEMIIPSEGRSQFAHRIILATRRMLTTQRPLTPSEREDFAVTIADGDTFGLPVQAAAWAACAANAFACVSNGLPYRPLVRQPHERDAFDTQTGGFPGAAAAGIACRIAHRGAATTGKRISVAHRVGRAIDEALVAKDAA